MKAFAAPALAILMIMGAACATGYQSMSFSGGFDETRLSEDTFQIRFVANAYTTPDRVSEFLLRRAAELTLENDRRYFIIRDQQGATSVHSAGLIGVVSKPSGNLMLKMLSDKSEDAFSIDAVMVVDETDAAAYGRLSEEARAAYERFQGSNGGS